MPKLYVKDYKKALAGSTVRVACREGILRDNFSDIIKDIKFLTRQDIQTELFHNMSNRFSNQKYFTELAAKLPQTYILRVPSDHDFYAFVLDHPRQISKILFIERKYLIGPNGYKINSISTQTARNDFRAYKDVIANANFKNAIEAICQKIESGQVERIHILPAGKDTIKHEMFSIEGSGTLIANNFKETFATLSEPEDINILFNILKGYRKQGYLKLRSREYLETHAGNFHIAKIDGIIVGCTEKIILTPKVVELACIAISAKFRNQRVGLFLIRSFISEMQNKGFAFIVSLTNNPKLRELYMSLGFSTGSLPEYKFRQEKSPGVKMFTKAI